MGEIETQSAIIELLTFLENQGKLWFTRLNVIPPVTKIGTKLIFRKMPNGAKTGISDLLVFKEGKTFWIEVKNKKWIREKAPKTKSKESQEKFEQAVKSHSGGSYHIVRTLQEFAEVIGFKNGR